MAGWCEAGEKHSNSTQWREFFEQFTICRLLKEVFAPWIPFLSVFLITLALESPHTNLVVILHAYSKRNNCSLHLWNKRTFLSLLSFRVCPLVSVGSYNIRKLIFVCFSCSSASFDNDIKVYMFTHFAGSSNVYRCSAGFTGILFCLQRAYEIFSPVTK